MEAKKQLKIFEVEKNVNEVFRNGSRDRPQLWSSAASFSAFFAQNKVATSI